MKLGKILASVGLAFILLVFLTACGSNQTPPPPDPGNKASPLNMATSSLASGTVGVGYNAHLIATGGTPPYRWSLASGTLPALLYLIPGYIAGVPNSAGTSNFTLKVTDSASATATQSFALTIVPSSVMVAPFQEAYSSNLTASFGTAPYTYLLESGSLPPGLTLAGNGAITGTATATGTFNFSVLVTDSLGAHQTAPYVMTVIVATGQYGGLTAAPVPGCTPGYFQLNKVNGRWVLADPACYAFPYLGVQNTQYVFYQDGNWSPFMQSKYGNTYQDPWMTRTKQRLQTWGFDAVGDYAYEPLYPHAATVTPRMPFIVLVKPASGAVYHPSYCNTDSRQYTQPIKELLAGLPSNLSSYNDGHTAMDTFDPMWADCVTYTLTYWRGIFGGDFNSNPWLIGITHEDMDDFRDLRGGAAPYLHLGFVIAVTNPSGTGGTGTQVWSKYAWACGIGGVDFGRGWGTGSSYLQHKYGTITALNAAWGSNYTDFCSAGGWGNGGTGVLDEDDRSGHQSWMGTDIAGLSNTNANVAADMNQFLYEYTYQSVHTMMAPFRAYDANHLMFALNFFGNEWTQTLRPPVLQAVKDSGVSAFHASYEPSQTAGGETPDYFMQTLYAQTGLPVITWYAVTANADSYWHDQCDSSGNNFVGPGNDLCNAQSDVNYGTQALRGEHYATDLSAIFNTRGADGTYFAVGMNFWGWSDDNSAEHTNYGLVSDNDDAYDGNCAIAGLSIDPFGYPCGGESLSYGDFTDAVSAANLNAVESFIALQLP